MLAQLCKRLLASSRRSLVQIFVEKKKLSSNKPTCSLISAVLSKSAGKYSPRPLADMHFLSRSEITVQFLYFFLLRGAHAFQSKPLGGSTSYLSSLPPLSSPPFPLSHPRSVPVSSILSNSAKPRPPETRYDQLRHQEPSLRGRRAPPGAASLRRPLSAVLPAHADPSPARARDRDVLRSAGHGTSAGTGADPNACSFAGGRGHRGEEGAEAVREADLPGGRRHVQPRHHVHGRGRRVLPFHLATGGRRGAGDRDVRHVCALRRRGGWDGVLGAVGAPGAVARVPVAHARVAPPAARRPLRAQRRVRHHQRRAGHLPPRLRLLPPRLPPRPLLRRGPRDYTVRCGLHVRPRRPGPPPLPCRPHRECALLPASGCGSQDTPHGQVRGRTVWAVPGTQGAGGGWWPGRAGEGARENQPEPECLIWMQNQKRFDHLVVVEKHSII